MSTWWSSGLTSESRSDLFVTAGASRPNCQLGIAGEYLLGLNHHSHRARGGSYTSYTDPARLVTGGVGLVNVEAAIDIDTDEGDPQSAFDNMSNAVDSSSDPWEIVDTSDLDRLVCEHIRA